MMSALSASRRSARASSRGASGRVHAPARLGPLPRVEAADPLELGRDAALPSEIAHPHFVELPQRFRGRNLGKAFLEGLSHFIHGTLTNDNGERRGPSPRRGARIGASGGPVVRRD